MDRGVENTIKELWEMNNYQKQHIEELTKQINQYEQIHNNEIRNLFVKYIWAYIGTWYSWGGDNPSGFDCSGIVIEGLQAFGKIGTKQDFTATGLKNLFIEKRVYEAYKGCLVLWHETYNQDKMVHVEVCINNRFSIGARGGGSKTITKADAIRDKAFIKIRPIRSRPMLWGYVDPFLEKEKKDED